MAQVERLRVYPVKSLDGIELDALPITDGGVLEYDRRYVLLDSNGDPINGRRDNRVHLLESSFDPDGQVLEITSPEDAASFDLENERGAAAAWFSDFFDESVSIERDDTHGFVDRPNAGPSVVSTETLEEVASWYDDLSVDEIRRRIRANVEISGTPAFWEDQFATGDDRSFAVGDIAFEGVEPCVRCVVPERDPGTGERLAGFRETFIEQRRETFPAWADESAFPTAYCLMLIARVPRSHRGKTIRVGDTVTVQSAEMEIDS